MERKDNAYKALNTSILPPYPFPYVETTEGKERRWIYCCGSCTPRPRIPDLHPLGNSVLLGFWSFLHRRTLEQGGFIWLNWRWLPSLIYCSIPKASPLPGSVWTDRSTGGCNHSRAAPLLGPRQRKIPTSFLSPSGFVEPGKEINSKGRKWPRDHNNIWKAKPVLPSLCFKLF